jgi:leucyl aminopeptidase (aminopeptidase T)
MSLRDGAETVINQCMDVHEDERVLILNDGNDQDIIDSLLEVLEARNLDKKLMEYEEPESSGTEPPAQVAEAMKDFDVVIAPTRKSISHTDAREEANQAGTRVATMPTVNKEIWNTSLQANYSEVERITMKVYELLKDTSEVKVTTPSGTDLKFKVDIDTYDLDTGLIRDQGSFGNLPAGEPSGFPQDIEGTLVIDHFQFSPSAKKVEIREGKVVALENEDGADVSALEKAFEKKPCSRKMAEFGFGTNPEATLIGNALQDEKVLGTVHFAFGDNTSYVGKEDERSNPCNIHWDAVCEEPTVWFDGIKVLDKGKPVFLDKE